MRILVGEHTYDVEIWEGGDVLVAPDESPVIAIDTETVMIIHGKPVIPALMQVCCHALRMVHIIPAHYMGEYCRRLFEENLALHSKMVFVFHTAPFDLEVLGINRTGGDYLLKAVSDSKVVDIGIRFILDRLSSGHTAEQWGLKVIAKMFLGIEVDKDDDIRLDFRPGMALTEKHVHYAATDAAITAQLYNMMPTAFPTEYLQLLGFISLHAIGYNGMLVDGTYLLDLETKIKEKQVNESRTLAIFGYYAGEPGNKKVLQNIMRNIEIDLQYLDRPDLFFERTAKSGEIQMTKESLAAMGNRVHPFVEAYRAFKKHEKILSTFLNPHLVRQDNRVHPVFSPLKKTGRTSCRTPNLQQVPRKGGIRGIYIAPPGWVLYAADYAQLELCALAESCLEWYGASAMAGVINSGQDIHQWFASVVTGKNIDDVTKDERQMAKACNFGFPGGLGIRTFQTIAMDAYDVSLSEDRCWDLRNEWKKTFPEMKYHLQPPVDIQFSNKETGEERYISRTITGRIKRNSPYCAACNYPFQGLSADGALLALWYIWREGYRIVNFVHDEVICELRQDEHLDRHVRRISELMVYGMSQVIKRVKINVEGVLMTRWYKEAEPVYDENGVLQIWKPEGETHGISTGT